MNDLVITKAKFKHRDIHKHTRKIISRIEKSIIDYFLVSRKQFNKSGDVKVLKETKIKSDYYLVKIELQTTKIKKERKKKQVKKK